MKEKIKLFAIRKKQLILYLLFGIITTVLSLAACYLTLKLGVRVWHDENGDPTALVDVLGSTSQWIVGVLVAFFTNKKWVFTEAKHGKIPTLKQLGIFSGSRIITYFLEVAINLGFIAFLEALHYSDIVLRLFGFEIDLSVRFWAKIVSSIVIVVSNYFISKLMVFKKE